MELELKNADSKLCQEMQSHKNTLDGFNAHKANIQFSKEEKINEAIRGECNVY